MRARARRAHQRAHVIARFAQLAGDGRADKPARSGNKDFVLLVPYVRAIARASRVNSFTIYVGAKAKVQGDDPGPGISRGSRPWRTFSQGPLAYVDKAVDYRRANGKGEQSAPRRTEAVGAQAQHDDRDAKATQSDHGVGHHRRRRRAADAAVQDDHDAGEHDGKYRQIAARRRPDAETQA